MDPLRWGRFELEAADVMLPAIVLPALVLALPGDMPGESLPEGLVPDCDPIDIVKALRCYVLCLQGKECDPALVPMAAISEPESRGADRA